MEGYDAFVTPVHPLRHVAADTSGAICDR